MKNVSWASLKQTFCHKLKKAFVMRNIWIYLAGCCCGWNNASKFQKLDSTKLLVGISVKPISRKIWRYSARTWEGQYLHFMWFLIIPLVRGASDHRGVWYPGQQSCKAWTLSPSRIQIEASQGSVQLQCVWWSVQSRALLSVWTTSQWLQAQVFSFCNLSSPSHPLLIHCQREGQKGEPE